MVPNTDVQVAPKLSRSAIRKNVLLMSMCFSLNHACVTTVIGLASSELGDTLGGVSVGVLYLMYTLTAMVGATGIVEKVGTKRALVTGAWAYCFYVGSFLLAILWESGEWGFCMAGSLLGGTAAGWLWTAQGAYFSVAVELHVDATQRGETTELLSKNAAEIAEEKTKVSAQLAGLFSMCYLGCEVGVKILSFGVLLAPGGSTFLFVVLTIIACVSSCGLSYIVQLEPKTSVEGGKPAWHSAFGALELLFTDRKMILLYPAEMAYGFFIAFVNYYAASKILDEYLSEASIPLLGSLISLVAAAVSMPFSSAAITYGKAPLMVGGLLALLLDMIVFTFLSDHTLGNWAILVPMYTVYGLARAVFEGQNKAILQDFFPQQGAAWSANFILSSGIAGGLGFILFPYLSKLAITTICSGTSFLGILGFILAQRLYEHEVAENLQKADFKGKSIVTGTGDAP
ncbi:hypothetical protein CYMTET_23170 [Cymbomonas tetramitiformis]|uniref:Uncharacterized protein n=1 Tax=Cymbomonas tetramitiformis TaxID=36881 RepID=A0AAE0FYF6_9CHLO|nr:hypothetical protein CYMTET_23170 [Cymbomonas tetramitiformis]